MTRKKLLIALILLLLFTTIAVGIYLVSRGQTNAPEVLEIENETEIEPVVETEPEIEGERYTDEEYGISFIVPEGWELDPQTLELGNLGLKVIITINEDQEKARCEGLLTEESNNNFKELSGEIGTIFIPIINDLNNIQTGFGPHQTFHVFSKIEQFENIEFGIVAKYDCLFRLGDVAYNFTVDIEPGVINQNDMRALEDFLKSVKF